MRNDEWKIRRRDRVITEAEALAVLDAAEYGVLSVVGADGVPYGVPINFVRDGDTLIFHCAPEGRKLECMRRQPRVSFCAVGRTRVLPGEFTTEYESVVVEGTATIIEDETRKIADLMKLCEKYSAEHLPAAETYIRRSLHRTGIFEIRMETVTGKGKKCKMENGK